MFRFTTVEEVVEAAMGDAVHSLLNLTARFGGQECRVEEAWETSNAVFIRIRGEATRATMTLDAAIQHGIVNASDVPAELRPVVEPVRKPAPRVVGRRLPKRPEPDAEAPLQFGRLRPE